MPPRNQLAAPPQWTTDQLKQARDAREEAFRTAWREEGPEQWVEACEDLLPQVEAMLQVTDNLRQISADHFRDNPTAWQLLRYVCAPVLSEENFWTLVGSPKSKAVRPEYADAVAEVISMVIDPVRFPWVADARDPSEQERYGAVLATVVLLAAQRVGTSTRGLRSQQQEAAVGAVLAAAGYDFIESRGRINLLDDLPRGSFSRETRVAGAKCDVPVRLLDGRLLAIECKVSIGPKNGWKRLNRETGGKAEGWRTHFGTAQVITAVVIDGVFDLGCLVQAQNDQGVVIFWDNDLQPLSEFVQAAN